MGIGSCFCIKDYHLFDQIHKEKTKEIYANSLIFVRDSLAKIQIESSGLDCTHIPCPSYFSTLEDNFPKTKDSLLVYYEPKIGVSQVDWHDPKKLQEFYDKNTEFQRKYNADVVVKEASEVEWAEKIGLPTPRVLTDSEDTLKTVSKYRRVLTGRVHIGVPALITGCSVELIPVDSRYLTISDFSGQNLTRDLSEDLKIYQSLIKKFLT